MKYLVIDTTKTMPITGVVERGGRHVGNTQMLCWGELKDYSRWLALFGGRSLVDAFEVQLINDGMLFVWPVDADGEPLHDECTALEIRHCDDGLRILWQARLQCVWCCGNGHHNLHGEPVEEEDLCMACGGDGYADGPEFETDIDGYPTGVRPPVIDHSDLFADARAGRRDAMGWPWAEWLVALDGPDGRPLRDADLRVVYVTQAEYQARHSAAPVQLKLFA